MHIHDSRSATIAAWHHDIHRAAPTWLPKPHLVVKRGYISPWFVPHLWFVRSGAFNFFWFIVVTDDFLDCPERQRRYVAAHECGHWAGLHGLIWIVFGLILHADQASVTNFYIHLAHKFGPAVSLATFAVSVVACVVVACGLQYFFEYQADAYAASKIGCGEAADSLEWLQKSLFIGKGRSETKWINQRINRLRRCATNR